jgi:HSP20 family protein
MPMELTTDQPLRNMATQMNKMMDQLVKGYFSYRPGETWTPPVNLYETASAYFVCVDLAGVHKEKVDIVVEDGRLTLRGTRNVPVIQAGRGNNSTCKARVHVMEIDHGPFVRQLELAPDAHPERISATYRAGLLWIELPKKKKKNSARDSR